MLLGFLKGLRDHIWDLMGDYFRESMMTIARQALCKTLWRDELKSRGVQADKPLCETFFVILRVTDSLSLFLFGSDMYAHTYCYIQTYTHTETSRHWQKDMLMLLDVLCLFLWERSQRQPKGVIVSRGRHLELSHAVFVWVNTPVCIVWHTKAKSSFIQQNTVRNLPNSSDSV